MSGLDVRGKRDFFIWDESPSGIRHLSPWIRFLAWFSFCILCLASLLVVTRLLVMNHGHQETLRITGARVSNPADIPGEHAQSPTAAQVSSPGLSLSEIPHIGQLLAGDDKEWDRFENGLLDIRNLIRTIRRGQQPAEANGTWNFRAVLRNMGADIPETMTEAEAASAFLRRVDGFSSLLAQWREAVAKGPLASGKDQRSDTIMWRFIRMSGYLTDLAETTTSAHLRTGDPTAAWKDLRMMQDSLKREKELLPADRWRDRLEEYQIFSVARSGVREGTWTEAQMAELSGSVARENFLMIARDDVEASKKGKMMYYENFRKNEALFRERYLKTSSPLNQVANRLKLRLITDQQIKDNMAIGLHKLDQQLKNFDPETGYYIQPTEAEKQASAESRQGVFGSYYFMIEDMNAVGDSDFRARYVIRQQTEYDQFRLSAALETYHRRTGSYPESLEAVSGGIPGGAPQDIATGQPYFYQKDTDGGYRIWGTGIDGKNDGGDDETDITWKQPARMK